MNWGKKMVKTISKKLYWTQILFLIAMQIVLPTLLGHFFPRFSLVSSQCTILFVSLVSIETSVSRCYFSSTLRRIIMVWILSSAILTVSSMLGFFWFNKENPNLILLIPGEGLFIMLFYLPVILWFYKKGVA